MSEQKTKTESLSLQKPDGEKPYKIQFFEPPAYQLPAPSATVEAVIEGRKYRGVLYLVEEL